MRPISYIRATDVASAVATASADPQRTFLAGGTTEIDLLRLNIVQHSGLVDINMLPLKQIEALADGGLRIGALACMSDGRSSILWRCSSSLGVHRSCARDGSPRAGTRRGTKKREKGRQEHRKHES